MLLYREVEVRVLRSAPIGVMDSGVGGLTVVSEIWRQLPREQVLFYGDSARCPYGDRTPEEIATFTFRALDYLVDRGVKMLVIACNTATAIVLKRARMRYRVPVVGVIAPGARAAIAATTARRVGVIGTRATIASNSYKNALYETHQGIEVRSLACPGFVEIVEADLMDTHHARSFIQESLTPMQGSGIDTLILGCTHYPLLAPIISGALGKGVKLISSAEETARDVSLWLTEHNMNRTDAASPHHVFLTSGDVSAFATIATKWLNSAVDVSYLDVWADAGVDAL